MFFGVHNDKLTVYDQLYAQNVGYDTVTIESSIKPSWILVWSRVKRTRLSAVCLCL